jgi:hypothetical protein
VVGELHGVDRPHLYAHALQRKNGGIIADVTISNMRLDGEDIHNPDNNRHGGEIPAVQLSPDIGLKSKPTSCPFS